jgi:hypothetical protein
MVQIDAVGPDINIAVELALDLTVSVRRWVGSACQV